MAYSKTWRNITPELGLIQNRILVVRQLVIKHNKTIIEKKFTKFNHLPSSQRLGIFMRTNKNKEIAEALYERYNISRRR